MASDPPVYRPADDVSPTTPAAAPTTSTPAAESGARGWRRPSRRLVWTLVVVLAVCVGAPVAVGIGMVGAETVKASRGAPTPTAALLSWVLSFRDPGAVDADRYVIAERRGELARVRAAFVAQMQETDPATRVEISGQKSTETIAGDEAMVVDHYAASIPADDGSLLSFRTKTLPWSAEARRSDGGWRLWSVTAPPWCGSGGYVARCGPPPAPASPAPQPSPSPSEDLLQNPRDMLRCGPKDPFREWHSCPPTTSASPG